MTKSSFSKEQLLDAYESFGSISAIARYYDVSTDIVRRNFKKYGLDYKSASRKFNCDEDFFSRDSEETFYWAGFLAANGNISTENNGKPSYKISLNLSLKDKEHLEKFKKALKSEAPVKELTINKETNPYETARFLISSKQLVTELSQRFFVVPRKTFIYKIPPWVERSPLVRHFLRGWVDGKGTFFVDPELGRTTYFRTSGTVVFLNSFMSILQRETGLEPKELKMTLSKEGRVMGALFYTRKEELEVIANYFYNDCNIYLSRKRDAALFGKRDDDTEE